MSDGKWHAIGRMPELLSGLRQVDFRSTKMNSKIEPNTLSSLF